MDGGDAARRLHESTKHTPESVRTHTHSPDRDHKPDPFKRYEAPASLVLPEDIPRLGVSALDAIHGPEMIDAARFDAGSVARLLGYGAGVLRRREYAGEVLFFRTYASAGALYPVEVYVACGDLPGIEAGVYHFHPHDRTLLRLRSGDHRGALVHATGGEPAVAEAPLVIALTGIPWRTCWKYTERGYRHLWWDAGTMLANLLALAGSAGWPARVVTGFDDQEVGELLGLDGKREFPLVLLSVGAGAKPPKADPAVRRFEAAEGPGPQTEVSHPVITEVHEAGRLEGAGSVERWREARVEVEEGSLEGIRRWSRAAEPPDVDLETVIRRRGSARRFGPVPMPFEVFTAVLEAAVLPIPVDRVPQASRLIRPFAVVHAVGGSAPGAYAWQEGGLRLVRAGALRFEAAHLCLDQRLGGEGAATIFLMTDLDRTLKVLGDRGYRVAQLEGGIVAGRLYLAAQTFGFGATGLTFYDDEVTEFFGPEAQGLECTLVVAVGQRSGRLLPLA